MVACAAVAFVVLLAGAAFAVYVLADDRYVHEGMGETDAPGPMELREPLRFAQVAEEFAPPCGPGRLPSIDGGACFRLETDGLTVHRLEELQTIPPSEGASWRIRLSLTMEDGDRFGRLTQKAAAAERGAPGQRIAIVVQDRVISAPAVLEPITGGWVEITGNFTEREVADLISRMTGR